MRRVAAPAVAGLLVALALAGCGGDRAAGGRAERFVTAQPEVVEGDTGEVVVPAGTVRVEVGEPRRSLRPSETADRDERTAPGGEAYLGVDWQFLPGDGLPPWWQVVMDDPEQRITLALRTGDETIPLGDARPVSATPEGARTAGGFFVRVPGDGDDLRIEVTFDGVTQTVDPRTGDRETSQAAGLYDAPEPRPRECDALSARPSRALRSDCSALSARLPYLPGHGWSTTGWPAVELTTTTRARGADGPRVTAVSDASTFGGEEPLAHTVALESPGVLSTILVGPESAEVLDIARQVTYRDRAGGTHRIDLEGAQKV